MIRGFDTAVTGLIANETRQTVVADNIANANTPGFKQSGTAQTAFEQELSRSGGGTLGPLATATTAVGPTLDQSAGALATTGQTTDLALDGGGLFVVQTATGTAYTRAGDFVIAASGTLTTQAGEPVLATDGRPIVVPGGAAAFSVGSDGTVAQTGQRIAVVPWPVSGVERLGGTLLAIIGPAPSLAAGGTAATGGAATIGAVRQGMLEQSNVDLSTAMTELLTFQRNLGLNARALTIQDGTLADVIQLGRPR